MFNCKQKTLSSKPNEIIVFEHDNDPYINSNFNVQ